MRLTQLKSLIKRGESDVLEFKSSTGSLTAGMQTVCAFLNSDRGGILIFGIKDDGKLVGQVVTDKTRRDIATEISKIDPSINIPLNCIKVAPDRYALVLNVPSGEKAPYTYEGRAFARRQSTTIRMSKEEYLYLHNRNNPELWEALTNNRCAFKDLDRRLIKEVVKMGVFNKRLPKGATAETAADFLEKLGLMQDGKCTNAAVILFCKSERKQFMQSTLQLARFRGTDKKSFITQKLYGGNAFDLYKKAEEFLSFILPVAAEIVPGQSSRVETPAIPYSVLREALINAFVHRDYGNAGGSIAVAVYDDRITITNTGHLPPGVTVQQLAKVHTSVPRNPRIAQVFYLYGEIEKWGRGTLDMIEACKEVGNPLPIFEEVGGGFSVTLPLKEPMITIIYK